MLQCNNVTIGSLGITKIITGLFIGIAKNYPNTRAILTQACKTSG